MLYRLKTDFRLSVITVMGGVSALFGIAPFAVYRFFQGQILAGVVDTLIVVGVLGFIAHAWISGRTSLSGIAIGLIGSVGISVVCQIVGSEGIIWVFPILVSNFFLAKPSYATSLNLIAIVGLILQPSIHDSAFHIWSFCAAALVVSTSAYVFAHRNESQRRTLEHLATIDPLTGVGNRRSMDQELVLAVANAERFDQPCTIVMLDLDHFKEINDEFGHSVGDGVLVELVCLIQQHTRRTDSLFRYGGEEFVLLLPGTEGVGVKKVMANLESVIRKYLSVNGRPVTASFGVAELDIGEGVDRWLERADDALYRAKEAGRDCVIYADELEAKTEIVASQGELLLT